MRLTDKFWADFEGLKLQFKARQPAFKAQAGLFGPAKLEEGSIGEGLPGGYWLQRLKD